MLCIVFRAYHSVDLSYSSPFNVIVFSVFVLFGVIIILFSCSFTSTESPFFMLYFLTHLFGRLITCVLFASCITFLSIFLLFVFYIFKIYLFLIIIRRIIRHKPKLYILLCLIVA